MSAGFFIGMALGAVAASAFAMAAFYKMRRNTSETIAETLAAMRKMKDVIDEQTARLVELEEERMDADE